MINHMSEKLKSAREYEALRMNAVPSEQRSAFHLSGPIGWINDPNGFSCYGGKIHQFFQYHPYSVHWGPMHWGHAVSTDFVRWEYLPCAMAPDKEYDRNGCFSGSAVTGPDGTHMLFYTGVRQERREDGTMRDIQTQCVAVGDGLNYEKYAGNPVLTAADLPEGASKHDFRDPKVWIKNGIFYMAVGNRLADGSGGVLLYTSEDGFSWKRKAVIDECRREYGLMWECPDVFSLDGKDVILVSPQEMEPSGYEFHAGGGTVCIIGMIDPETFRMSREHVQATDYGIDFYATQTLLTPDGRRIMTAWMDNWDACFSKPHGAQIFGEMILPRELSVRKGRLCQNPVREIEAYRKDKTECAAEILPEMGPVEFDGINGRQIDMTVNIRPTGEFVYHSFTITVAADEKRKTTIRFKPYSNKIRVDRSGSGFPHDIVNMREFLVADHGGALKIRILLDRHSMELFFNDGEQAATFKLYTPASADRIFFQSDGPAAIECVKYNI